LRFPLILFFGGFFSTFALAAALTRIKNADLKSETSATILALSQWWGMVAVEVERMEQRIVSFLRDRRLPQANGIQYPIPSNKMYDILTYQSCTSLPHMITNLNVYVYVYVTALSTCVVSGDKNN